MISKQRFLEVAERAFDAASEQFDAYGGRPGDFLGDRYDRRDRIQMVVNLAAALGVEVWPLPVPDGFGSWLYFTDRTYIAIDIDQLDDWASKTGVPREVQMTRAVLKEVAHLLMGNHPDLGAGQSLKGFAVAVSPTDDEAAWVFAMTFLGLTLGDRVEQTRRDISTIAPDGRDEGPSYAL